MLRSRSWPPYLVGAGLGVLSWFAFLTADHGLGITTAFEHSAALAIRPFAPFAAYFNDPVNDPKIGWEWMLVVGVFFGSLASAALSRDRTTRSVPDTWRARFGGSRGRRLAAAFLGGAVMMFGARVAQGCTSGHGITGALQLAVSSWIFLATLAVAGVAWAWLLYRSGERHHV